MVSVGDQLGERAELHRRTRGRGSLAEMNQRLRVQLVGYGPSASTIGANRAGRVAARNVRHSLI